MTRLALLIACAAAASAAPQGGPGYVLPTPANSAPFTVVRRPVGTDRPIVPFQHNLPSAPAARQFGNFDSLELESIESVEVPTGCPTGQLRHGNRCVRPKINRNIFVFGKSEDSHEAQAIDYAKVPLPQLEYNIIFVRPSSAKKPVVVPPPQKKTVVYVLEDEPSPSEEILEVQSHPEVEPEVYYVKVRPGENPQLPGGINLHDAYNQALQDSTAGGLAQSVELSLGSGGIRTGGVSLESLAEHTALTGGAGVPLPPAGKVGATGPGPAPSFNFANLADVGVPLPTGGFTAGAQTSAPQQSLDNSLQQGLGANLANPQTLINLMKSSLAAQGLELDFDNGVPSLSPASFEVEAQPALRYSLPN